MGLLKGQVLTPKFTTAEISDSDNRIYYVPIKHMIGEYFLCEIDGKYFAFTTRNARILTHRSKTGIGKAFQVIQYDTTHAHCLNPTTKELEQMLKINSLGKMNRQKHEILSILGRREKENFGKWKVGDKDFDTFKDAKAYHDTLDKTGWDELKKNEYEPIQVKHSIEELAKIFEKEKGEFPEQVREIKAYLNSLDIKHIVTPLRPITEFITEDLIATNPSFMGEGIARYQRLEGNLREITNVPVKPKGKLMLYLVIGLIVFAGVAAIYIGYDSGAFDGIIGFTDNLSTIQEGFKGIPAPGQFQSVPTGGASGDYSDATIQAKYPDCESITAALNSGELDYNKLSGSMKGLVDTC